MIRKFGLALGLGLMLCMGAAQAQNLSTQGLSQEQINTLTTMAQAMKSPAETARSTASHVSEWVQLGANIGQGLASAAREVGVATNEFAQTSLGKVAIGILLFKMIGGTILHVLFSMVWFAVAIPLWAYFYRRQVLGYRVREQFDRDTGKLISRDKSYENNSSAEAKVMYWISLIAIGGTGIIAFFTGV